MQPINSKLRIVFSVGFLFSVHVALLSYINSSFLSGIIGQEKIGLIYALGSLISVIMLFVMPKVLERAGSYKFILLSSLFSAIALFYISNTNNSLGLAAVFVLYLGLNNIFIFTLDEILEIFSENKYLGQVRGLYLTIINTAWVLAQPISGTILNNLNFSSLYLVAFLIMTLVFLVSLFGLRNIKDPKYDQTPATKSVGNFFRNKNLFRAYKINFLLQFFFAWMIIYTPIYLSQHIGFSWKEISTIFTVMLLPFVLLQIPLGRYSDKIGERKMLMLGFLISGIATFCLFFLKVQIVWVWALALFTTRIGAATIEVMSDVYFFKHITKEKDEWIGVYRNAIPTAFIIAPLLASAFLVLLPEFNFLFLILSTLMFYGLYLSSTINKTDI